MGPVIGASVIEKGNPANGTITDIYGNFSLTVKSGATLAVSYIGYKPQEVQAIAGKSININLQEDTEMLDEVVVVGFGTQKKVNLTGSVGIAYGKGAGISSGSQCYDGSARFDTGYSDIHKYW